MIDFSIDMPLKYFTCRECFKKFNPSFYYKGTRGCPTCPICWHWGCSTPLKCSETPSFDCDQCRAQKTHIRERLATNDGVIIGYYSNSPLVNTILKIEMLVIGKK